MFAVVFSATFNMYVCMCIYTYTKMWTFQMQIDKNYDLFETSVMWGTLKR